MTIAPFSLPAALAGAGLASFSLGCARPLDTAWKQAGTALLALSAALTATPARADQFIEAADNARIDCMLSRGELTRISLVGDGFANVSKIASGYPYNDFGITHEPLRGDIYISVPPEFASDSVSFFATSKNGYVYKFACRTSPTEAQQLFITNPAIAKPEAEKWETDASPDDAAIALIKAMASDGAVPGYGIIQKIGAPTRTGSAEVQLIAEYRGSRLTGRALTINNRGAAPMDLVDSELAPAGALAFATPKETLAPGETARVFLVTANGAINQ